MIGGAIILVLLAGGAPGDGQGIDPPAALTMEVAVDAGLTDRDLGAALVQHLQVELGAAHVTVVAAGAATTIATAAPQARLTVGPVSGNPRAVSLELRYRRSDAAVHRTLDLSSLASDGALVAIAVAVDELLRASWSLLSVSAAPPRPASPVVVASPGPAPAPRAEARLLLSGERHRGGTITVGPDVVLAVQLGERWTLEVRGGWRSAGSRQVPDGTIDSSAVTGGIGVAWALTAPDNDRRAGVELAARLDGAWVSAHGTARAGATGYGATALGVGAVAGVGGWVALVAPLRLVAFAGWQLPLRSVGASDGDASAGAVYQPGFCAAAGIGARF